MDAIKNRVLKIENEIQKTAKACGRDFRDISLIGVSKKKSVDTIIKGVNAGIKILGENYIQEAVEKIEKIGSIPCDWHFIGHLQSNKAKFAVKYFNLIHTVDTIKLAKEINKKAKKINKIQNILMQVNISEEKSKSGVLAKNSCSFAKEITNFKNISLNGLMCIPEFSYDPEKSRQYFKALFNIKNKIQNTLKIKIKHLSMGMSYDFKIAIQEGATIVRIGTAIFGERK
ncbi:MAG: YggS family pyridoxal phosphate enzyme [Desulfobacteraceae bacterium 4572_130]|nr:MAG: YggS family pyridoxal phosphate enzyme [Desulfobacteraceae bacterium 4572_130]